MLRTPSSHHFLHLLRVLQKRKERQQSEMAVDEVDEEILPAKRRRLLPREMRTRDASENQDEEISYAAVKASDLMEGTTPTEEAKPNNLIFTLGFDELKGAKSKHATRARVAAKIKTASKLKRVRSKSFKEDKEQQSAMQL